MDPVIQRLELLGKEIANATAEAKGAQEAWLSATDPQQETKLEKIWQQLVKDKELLLADRKALGDQLTGPGVHTLLLAHNCSMSIAEPMVRVTQCVHLFASCPLLNQVCSMSPSCTRCYMRALAG